MLIIIPLIILILLIICLRLNKRKKENFKQYFEFNKPKCWKELPYTDKLKIYGKNLNKEHSFYADKLRVKTYINKLNITNLYTAKTITILDKYTPQLDLSKLPKNCVIKSNNSWNKIIIIKNGKIKLIKPNISYKKWIKESIKPHITKYEKHYINIQPEIFVEEYLGDNISDYKFICFHGEIKFVSLVTNVLNNSHCKNNYDINFNLLAFTNGAPNCKNIHKYPKNFKKMVNIAKELSKPFEFVRIDLYDINDKIYFGEFTFVPSEGGSNIKPKIYDKQLGSYW